MHQEVKTRSIHNVSAYIIVLVYISGCDVKFLQHGLYTYTIRFVIQQHLTNIDSATRQTTNSHVDAFEGLHLLFDVTNCVVF